MVGKAQRLSIIRGKVIGPTFKSTKALRQLIRNAVHAGVLEQAEWLNPEVLQQLYGLTAAEARLSVALASGKSLEKYCDATGIGINTVRSYLKLVLQKAATNRHRRNLWHCFAVDLCHQYDNGRYFSGCNHWLRQIRGRPIRAVGSSPSMRSNRLMPKPSDLKLPAQSMGCSAST